MVVQLKSHMWPDVYYIVFDARLLSAHLISSCIKPEFVLIRICPIQLTLAHTDLSAKMEFVPLKNARLLQNIFLNVGLEMYVCSCACTVILFLFQTH